ncbi:FGGY carbohydrate kinase domain-containing protein isoform X1 [Bufo bufo]|uniref:FGGY carbohydrate kinase domain-containing protein isoform X1 n=2 Tax=Bufo bufo TaxID=8384 RepID=UPI001ABEE045|nr:FGGY carbohydrate kinase domain-containing protein isoform X1 [Bufo bufo]XP_040264003.1 FGGY carbohydrate kinase domain-containing protein isoform X1 [Bufo bufo]
MQKQRTNAPSYYIGVDVGTASVRAALVDQSGMVIDQAEEALTIWEPRPDHYEQSSDDIWRACCAVTKKVAQSAGGGRIRGLGFDATCSLVVLDKQLQPLAVNAEGAHNRNVIMWMDHRAGSQVERINRTKHGVLRYVGGIMSVEMQPPKLLWLKENLGQECWDKAGHFFDLPDFLSWKATGSLTRSLCTLVCKWTYSSDRGWDDSFWKEIGLEDVIEDNYSKIGNRVVSPGVSVGNNLMSQAARDLGLPEGVAVAASLIDAHAGGLGVIGADVTGYNLPREAQPITSRLALICGTSSCHMAISEEPIFVPGVWGPYYSAMVPGFWLNEGGQSATGKLIDHVVQGHDGFSDLQKKANSRGQHLYAFLNDHLDQIRALGPQDSLTGDLHVWPDFHGNRSPLADLTLKGMVVGLTLSRGLDDLALLYLATVQSLALGTRHILETMKSSGHNISSLFLCGGLSKNPLFVQMHADITGLPVVLSREVESVLVGAAILGACASGDFTSIGEAMQKMAKVGKIVLPNPEHKRFYEKKYQVFLKLYDHQKEYQAIMDGR